MQTIHKLWLQKWKWKCTRELEMKETKSNWTDELHAKIELDGLNLIGLDWRWWWKETKHSQPMNNWTPWIVEQNMWTEQKKKQIEKKNKKQPKRSQTIEPNWIIFEPFNSNECRSLFSALHHSTHPETSDSVLDSRRCIDDNSKPICPILRRKSGQVLCK